MLGSLSPGHKILGNSSELISPERRINSQGPSISAGIVNNLKLVPNDMNSLTGN